MLRTMQIIALAMPQGVVLFGMIAVFAMGALSQPPSGTVVSLVAVAFAAIAFVAHLVISKIMARQGGSRQSPGYADYQTQMIIKIALLEGAAFFNIIATIIEHNWWNLGIAGLLVGWMLANFPTRNRVEHWIAA